CRSLTRSSSGRGSLDTSSSSRSTRAISRSTSSMRKEPRHSGKLPFPRWPEGFLLGADACAEQEAVEGREDERRNPGAVRERDASHLGDHGYVIGMPEESIGTPAPHEGPIWNHDHPHVPAPAEGGDGPPAQTLGAQGQGGADETQGSGEGSVQQQHLGGAAGQEERVDSRHPAELGRAALGPSVRSRDPGVAPREQELRHPLHPEQREKDQVRGHHSSSTSSEQKPGPIASKSPLSPGRASPEESKSESTKRTDAEERFPTCSSESQLRRMAERGSSRVSSTASSTRGPPVWHTQCATSLRESPCAARKESTSPR